MSKQITINADILQAVLNTLELVEIKGFSNMDRMYGTMRTIQGLLKTKTSVEEEKQKVGE